MAKIWYQSNETIPTHLAFYMEGSVPNCERDTVQKGLSFLS